MRLVCLAACLICAVMLANPALGEPATPPQEGSSADDPFGDELAAFARDTLNALQKNSIKGRREYCGFIGRDAAKRLVASPARPGTQASCTMPRLPRGFKPIATYHTHGAFDLGYDNETPSYQDLRSDIDAALHGFISTPGGRLWYSDKDAEEVRLVCGPRCLITDPRYSEARHGEVAPVYSLKALARR